MIKLIKGILDFFNIKIHTVTILLEKKLINTEILRSHLSMINIMLKINKGIQSIKKYPGLTKLLWHSNIRE